jgi:hypothetical protein
MKYLLDLLHQRNWVVQKLYKASKYSNPDVHHYVFILASGYPVCDCMMGINLGIPCRHVYAVIYQTDTMFHISILNPR